MFFDSHVHLNLEPLRRDAGAVVARAREAGVTGMVVVGIDLETSREAAEMAGRFEGVLATAGIHPHEAEATDGDVLGELREMLRSGRYAAVGEAGLDYHRDRSPRDAQRRVFRAQIEMALELDLPLVVHMRDAHEDGLALLEEHAGAGLRGVMHCFGGDAADAGRALGMGLHVSFAGPLTFPKAERTREIAAAVPLERTLVETDCPFLAPQPIRGQTNEPAAVRFVVEAQARLRGLPVEEVARRTEENARRLFGAGEGGEP
jgi:TatD DNase family protein